MKVRMFAALLAAPVLAVVTATAALASTGASVASHDVAGYQLSGRNFRYIQTTFKLPTDTQCEAAVAQTPEGLGGAVTLGPAEESNAGISDPPDASTVGISMVPSATGCGPMSPSFASNLPGYSSANQFPAGAIELNPGDTVKLELFYDQAGLVTTATVMNLTNPQTATASLAAPAHYTKASITAGFGPYTNSGTTSRLFLFTGSRATTYPGNRGPLLGGPWTTSRVIMINNGVTNVSPGSVWDSGQNFAVRTH